VFSRHAAEALSEVPFHQNIGKSPEVVTPFGIGELAEGGESLFGIAVDEFRGFFKHAAAFEDGFDIGDAFLVDAFVHVYGVQEVVVFAAGQFERAEKEVGFLSV